MLPGKVISLDLHELKMLLDQAMLRLAVQAKQQLLVHQFLAGLQVLELLEILRFSPSGGTC